MKFKNSISYICLLIYSFNLTAQNLGETCSGDKGEPVFTETFGTKASGVDRATIGVAGSQFAVGMFNSQPRDGFYTISNQFNWFGTWHNTVDHTEGDIDGNALIINADDTKAGSFFRRSITGLCEGTTYEFSAWVLNVSGTFNTFCTDLTGIPGGIPVNLKFEILGSTEPIPLKTFNTGDIFADATPIWKKVSLIFQTAVGQEEVVLRISNNGIGGCGNDLALDDIEFASCGDRTEVTSNLVDNSLTSFCEMLPSGFVLNANPITSVPKTHVFQWQESLDGIVYTDIIGENSENYTPPSNLNVGTYYYRVVVAENNSALMNSFCSSLSEAFVIRIVETPAAPIPNRTPGFCEGDVVTISVGAPMPNVSISWYDALVGGSLLTTSPNYSPGELVADTYSFYAEASSDNVMDCVSPRVEVVVEVNSLPVLKGDEKLEICPGDSVVLDSDIAGSGITYLWNTGETSRTISVSVAGNYSVNVENSTGCDDDIKFEVILLSSPVIKEVVSEEGEVRIILEQGGNYEFSIDGGITFQESPLFTNVKTGKYTAVVRDLGGCLLRDEFEFPHINIPKFFTPNGDAINDTFLIENASSIFLAASMQVFDRYGRLLFTSSDTIEWDGNVGGNPLPTDDYWYLINLESNIIKGNVSLIR